MQTESFLSCGSNKVTDYSKKIQNFAEAYRSGVYTKDEAIGAILDLLVEAPDFRILWGEVPDWVQSPIREYLKVLDDYATLYDSSAKTFAPVEPRLLELKRWLVSK